MYPSNPRAREDAVCVNVPGSFTSGRLFLFFFLSFDLLTHRGQSPQGKGERMVMDLQDQSAILEYQSNIRLFGTSSQVLTADDPQDDDDSSDDDEGFSSEDNNDSEDDADDCGFENGEEAENITPQSQVLENTTSIQKVLKDGKTKKFQTQYHISSSQETLTATTTTPVT